MSTDIPYCCSTDLNGATSLELPPVGRAVTFKVNLDIRYIMVRPHRFEDLSTDF